MALGDVLNVGQDMLLCISGEGSLQVFDITSEPDAWTASETVVLSGPTVRHPVPVNICRACVADIDGDGHEEIVIPVSYFFDKCAVMAGGVSGAGGGPSAPCAALRFTAP